VKLHRAAVHGRYLIQTFTFALRVCCLLRLIQRHFSSSQVQHYTIPPQRSPVLILAQLGASTIKHKIPPLSMNITTFEVSDDMDHCAASNSVSFDASPAISSVTENCRDPMARSSLHETYDSHQISDMESVSGSCISQESGYYLENAPVVMSTVMQDAPTMHGTNPDTSVQEALMPEGVDIEPDKEGIISRKWHWKTIGVILGFLLAGQFSGLTSRNVLLTRDNVFMCAWPLLAVRSSRQIAYRLWKSPAISGLLRLLSTSNAIQVFIDSWDRGMLHTVSLAHPSRTRNIDLTD
jgi:hypothetical protein